MIKKIKNNKNDAIFHQVYRQVINLLHNKKIVKKHPTSPYLCNTKTVYVSWLSKSEMTDRFITNLVGVND